VETSNYLAVCFFVTEKLYTRGCNSLFWLFIGGWNIWDVYSNTQQHINKFASTWFSRPRKQLLY